MPLAPFNTLRCGPDATACVEQVMLTPPFVQVTLFVRFSLAWPPQIKESVEKVLSTYKQLNEENASLKRSAARGGLDISEALTASLSRSGESSRAVLGPAHVRPLRVITVRRV
jgi:hypothetical protein